MSHRPTNWNWNHVCLDLSKFISHAQSCDRLQSSLLLSPGSGRWSRIERLLLIMRMRQLEFCTKSRQVGSSQEIEVNFRHTLDRIIPQLVALHYDLSQVEAVFGELVTLENVDDQQDFNNYLLAFSQGDPGLEQIFMSKVIWEWSQKGGQQTSQRSQFLSHVIAMRPWKIHDSSSSHDMWPQKMIPLQDDIAIAFCNSEGSQWEITYVSKLLSINGSSDKYESPSYFYHQSQSILYEWLDFSGSNEERLVFKVCWPQGQTFSLPTPDIPYIHHLTAVQGKNSEHYVSALAVPREELWEWLGKHFEEIEILSPDRWKKIYHLTKHKASS